MTDVLYSQVASALIRDINGEAGHSNRGKNKLYKDKCNISQEYKGGLSGRGVT